ncbi:hypothetical protein MMC12_007428 [Toensbergia leucococca]|nr:hypothetical protein [Toensbergia leucococca]
MKVNKRAAEVADAAVAYKFLDKETVKIAVDKRAAEVADAAVTYIFIDENTIERDSKMANEVLSVKK